MSINTLLVDNADKSWSNLYINSLKIYKKLTVCGELEMGDGAQVLLEHIQEGPPNTFLHTNLLNEVVWEPIDSLNTDIDADQINGGADGQILRYQSPNGTQWFDKILNSNLPDSVVIVNSATIGSNLTANNLAASNNISAGAGISAAGVISAPTFQGSLAQNFITAGNNNDYLRTICGVSTWVAGFAQQGCHVQLANSFALNSTTTNIIFDDVVSAGTYNNGEYNIGTGVLTLPAGGIQRWHIDVQIAYAFNGIHPRVDNELVVLLNGSNLSSCDIVYGDDINDNIMYHTSFTFQGTTGDLISVQFNSESNDPSQVISATDLSHISAYRIY